ncbi:hypothetical protein CR513_18715, partial [Mucuna pruriens]
MRTLGSISRKSSHFMISRSNTNSRRHRDHLINGTGFAERHTLSQSREPPLYSCLALRTIQPLTIQAESMPTPTLSWKDSNRPRLGPTNSLQAKAGETMITLNLRGERSFGIVLGVGHDQVWGRGETPEDEASVVWKERPVKVWENLDDLGPSRVLA